MKKILLMLALMLPCLGVWAQIQPSTKTDAPEYLYKIKSKNNLYVAAHSNPTQTNYGRFAFYSVEGKDNTYKIYSYDANLWLSYTKADSYSDGMNFVSFAQTQETADEWCVTTASNGYYQIAPYNNTGVAGRYWNFYGGIANVYYSYDDYKNTLGLYNKNADGDGGSAWAFEAVDGSDYAAPTTLNYVLTDGNGYVYNGTYTGVAGRTRLFTSQNTLCPITDVTFEGNTYKANIAIPFHTSGVVISSFNGNDIRFAIKEGKEIATKTVPTTETINNYLWNIHPSFANNTLTFSIQNVATGKYLHTTATSRAHADETITLEDEGTQFVYVANNGFKYGNLWLSTNSSSSSEQCLGMWDSQHNGAKHLIHKVNNYTITDAAGNVYEGEFNGYDLKNEAFLPTFTGVEEYTLSDNSWDGYNFSATIDFNLPFAVSSETTTNFISIGQGTWGDPNGADAYAKLWTVVGGNVKVVNGTPTLGAAQWMVYPTLNGTEFGFKIKSASTGKYVTANPESNADATASKTPVTLTENGTAFQFINTGIAGTNGFAYTNNGGTTLFITRNGEGDNNALLGVFGSSSSHQGNGVRFPEFNRYQVVIGEAGYTTVYSPFTAITNDPNNNPENYTNNNFVEIYTIAEEANFNKDEQEWKVPLVQATYYIPANSAAILKGKGTFVFTKADEDYRDAETDAIWANNNLKGSSVNTYVAEDAYMLSAPEGVESIGLYPILLNKNAEGTDGNTHFLNNAGKAYILAEDLFPTTLGTSGKVRFSFGGETTAIESVINNSVDTNAPIYDLSGRRVVNAVKGGIYIQNGKKVYIK